MYYIGIDLGTSAVKLLLMDSDGNIKNIVSKEYEISFPHTGWSEQSADDWWLAVKSGLKELIKSVPNEEIKGIGVAGQMHGLVIIDDKDRVIRP
ncbi:MAG: xylulokinase, partial [Lachnospiraceae bacterium]|nr:xylulokinase [Lachnospiraceae bacterium]